MPTVDEVLSLSKQILEKQSEVDALRLQLERLTGLAKETAGPRNVASIVDSMSTHPGKTPDRIMRLLAERSGVAMSAGEVATALPGLSVKLVQNTLLRLAKRGHLESPARGKYRVPAPRVIKFAEAS